jgi:hypothetical protein
MGVAQEKYFYKLQKLSASELDLVRKMFIDPQKDHPMYPLLEGWVSAFEMPFKSVDHLKTNGLLPNDDDELLEYLQKNILENLHMNIESAGQAALDFLKDGRVDFFKDRDAAVSFLMFICVQYFRTKGMRKSFLSVAKNSPVGDLSKAGDLIAILLSTKLAHNLFVSGKWYIQLLENKTGIHFLTGDQPVLNTHCYEPSPKKEAEKLEFYYPITPERAVLVTETSSSDEPIQLSAEQVAHYNSMIISISAEQLFATSEAQLSGLLESANLQQEEYE